jgi:hypothetical protein
MLVEVRAGALLSRWLFLVTPLLGVSFFPLYRRPFVGSD